MTALTVQVVANDEDGFIRLGVDSGGFYGGNTTAFTTNARVKVGQHSQAGGSSYEPDTYWGWIHLKNLTIPQGATINEAKLHFYHHANNGFDQMEDPGEGFTVKAEDTDSASKPTSYAHVSGWTLTSAGVATGSLINADMGDSCMGPDQEFADQWYPTHASAGAGLEIKTVLQELVNRSGWSSGSNVNLKLTPTDHGGSVDWDIEWRDRDAGTATFNGSAASSMALVIDYTAGTTVTTSPAFLLFV